MKNLALVMVVSFMMTLAVIIGFGYGAFETGIVTVEKDEQEHNKVIMVDGVPIEEHNWTETKGFVIHMDLNDEAYVEL